MLDRSGVLDRIEGARLDLGCGPTKRSDQYVGIDTLDLPGVDLVGDAYEVLAAIPDGVIAEVYTSHFMEHIDDVPRMLGEIARVVRDGGCIEIIVPHFSNPYFYSDLTHKHPFGLYTLVYLLPQNPFRRQVPSYSEPIPLQLESVRLEFLSPRPFYFRYAFKRVLQTFVNSSRWSQEFYEENLTGVLPCYQLRFLLWRDSSPC